MFFFFCVSDCCFLCLWSQAELFLESCVDVMSAGPRDMATILRVMQRLVTSCVVSPDVATAAAALLPPPPTSTSGAGREGPLQAVLRHVTAAVTARLSNPKRLRPPVLAAAVLCLLPTAAFHVEDCTHAELLHQSGQPPVWEKKSYNLFMFRVAAN
jgi:hypothetical protein